MLDEKYQEKCYTYKILLLLHIYYINTTIKLRKYSKMLTVVNTERQTGPILFHFLNCLQLRCAT